MCYFFRVLASLNLPAAIEDVSGDTVPQSILTKSTSVIEQGGIQTVDQLIKELPELLQRNREILDEVCFKWFAYSYWVSQGGHLGELLWPRACPSALRGIPVE